MTDERPLTVAVVGAGYFGQFHYEAWTRVPEVKLAALVENDEEKGHSTATRFDVPKAFRSLSELLQEGTPDLLDIVTPPHTHRELVATAAGKLPWIICQKPLAPTLVEAEEIVNLAAASGSKLIVHENFRFQPWYREAKWLLDDGRLGKIHAVSFRLRPGDGQGPRAYLDRQPYFQEMPRFLIHETGVHFIDTFRFLLGEMSAVTATLRRMNPAIAGEDAGYVIFEFENGAGGVFDGNRLNDHEADNCRLTMGELHLDGSSGVLRLDGFGRLWLKPHGCVEVEHPYKWNEGTFAGDCVYGLIRHIVDHIKSGSPIENEGRDYLRNMEIVEAVYRSHESGERISLETTPQS